MEKYSKKVIERIESYQKRYLQKKYGPDFENKLSEIFGDGSELFAFVEKSLEDEFGEDHDNRFKVEAQLKNDLLNETENITRYELRSHKELVNMAEKTFSFATGTDSKELPYSASLDSNEVSAEINEWTDLDKPIIFFHGGLFVANLLFCKLYAQLTPHSEKAQIFVDESKVLAKVPLVKNRIEEFFHFYISSEPKKAPQYQFHSNFQRNILSELLESISLFIFAHEVGHFYNEDFKNFDSKTTQQKWDDEIRADLHAINLILELYRKKEEPIGFTLLGPIIFFKYLILQEKNKPGFEDIDSHPPAVERLKSYFFYFDRLTTDEEKKKFDKLVHLEHYISESILSVFKEVANATQQ